jgi:hypothetical protein
MQGPRSSQPGGEQLASVVLVVVVVGAIVVDVVDGAIAVVAGGVRGARVRARAPRSI